MCELDIAHAHTHSSNTPMTLIQEHFFYPTNGKYKLFLFCFVLIVFLTVDYQFCQLTRPQLMEMPSLARSPVAPVLFSLSEPARSTKWNFAVKVSNSACVESVSLPSSNCWFCHKVIIWQCGCYFVRHIYRHHICHKMSIN